MSQKLNLGNLRVSSLDEILQPITDILKPLKKSRNILIETGNKVSLLKYEGVEIGSKDPLRMRVNRDCKIYCLGNILMPTKNDSYTTGDISKRITGNAKLEILGIHRLDFNFDEEFDLHLPSAKRHSDLYLNLANKFGDGRIEKLNKDIKIITDESLILTRLKEINRKSYFGENIVPFLENKPSNFEMPEWRTNRNIFSGLVNLIKRNTNLEKPKYNHFNLFVGQKWLSNVTKDLEYGDFVYIGSKEEVYLLGITKNKDNQLYNQGTYTTSTKPIFWFSNNYLGHTSKIDVSYHNSKPIKLGGKPFIFGAMGRSQDCKNSLFTGEPEIITGDISKAINHFKTTNFKEYEDVVKNYAKNIRTINKKVKPNGKFYF